MDGDCSGEIDTDEPGNLMGLVTEKGLAGAQAINFRIHINRNDDRGIIPTGFVGAVKKWLGGSKLNHRPDLTGPPRELTHEEMRQMFELCLHGDVHPLASRRQAIGGGYDFLRHRILALPAPFPHPAASQLHGFFY